MYALQRRLHYKVIYDLYERLLSPLLTYFDVFLIDSSRSQREECQHFERNFCRRVYSMLKISSTNFKFRYWPKVTILPSDLTRAGSEFHTVGAATEKSRVPAFVSPDECKEGYYWLSVAVWNFLLELALHLDMLVV